MLFCTYPQSMVWLEAKCNRTGTLLSIMERFHSRFRFISPKINFSKNTIAVQMFSKYIAKKR